MLTIKLFPEKPEPDESIIFPETYGWLENGELNIQIRGWIFELEDDSVLRHGFVELLEEYSDDISSDEKKILGERIKYFLTDNKRGKNIKIKISEKEYTLNKTSPNGHTTSLIKIKYRKKIEDDASDVTFSTLPEKNENKIFSGSFKIIGEKGYSIISDIDDTIKESNVLDKKELVKNTFIRKFRPVKGMSDLYRKFEKKNVCFHYVSGSPWQLYPAINNFLNDEQFPRGSVELKLFRVKDRSAIKFITADQMDYKISSIKTIINRFQERKFILIGDSGEKDPEVYSEIAGQYKDKIKFIFIRDVGLIEENSSRRKSVTEKAGNVKIIIFKKTGELTRFLKEL
jgi:phosphatidate phosphatase APP1